MTHDFRYQNFWKPRTHNARVLHEITESTADLYSNLSQNLVTEVTAESTLIQTRATIGLNENGVS